MSEPGSTSPRILIVAENASTQFGGEAIIPYHYFRLLRARSLDAHLIVHARCREELQNLFPDDLDRIHFVKDQLLQKLFFHLGKLLPRRISESTFGLANQMLTQRAQRRTIRPLVTVRSVIHQPIPVSPRFPSLLFNLDAPVVIGPLNGGMDYPPAFQGAESALSRGLITLGRGFTDLINTIFPGKRQAAAILVANTRTRGVLPAGITGRILRMPENAVDTAQWTSAPVRSGNSFVFIGRLVDWKALDIVIEALRSVPEASLDVIGDGPMLPVWRALVAQFDLTSRVRFHGWLDQSACAAHLAGSCALVLPSIYESGGAVVLEAMAVGRPVIATAWGGPCDYLDPTCGILLEPSSRTALIRGFADAMRLLLASPALRDRMGKAAREKLLRHFDWNHKIDHMLTIYNQAIPRNSSVTNSVH